MVSSPSSILPIHLGSHFLSLFPLFPFQTFPHFLSCFHVSSFHINPFSILCIYFSFHFLLFLVNISYLCSYFLCFSSLTHTLTRIFTATVLSLRLSPPVFYAGAEEDGGGVQRLPVGSSSVVFSPSAAAIITLLPHPLLITRSCNSIAKAAVAEGER